MIDMIDMKHTIAVFVALGFFVLGLMLLNHPLYFSGFGMIGAISFFVYAKSLED